MTPEVLNLRELESRVCDICSEELGILREKVRPDTRLVEDLGVDSLEVMDLIMEMEEHFGVKLPENTPNPAYKVVFTRSPFRLSDLAELVYLQREAVPKRHELPLAPAEESRGAAPFTQLDGRWKDDGRELFELLDTPNPERHFRRRSDGMRCVEIPSAEVEIGSTDDHGEWDEAPVHRVQLDRFLIDAEPVSTTAYCRFLNSIGPVKPALLDDWFIPAPDDDRVEHLLISQMSAGDWHPLPGTEHWPMMLVSWYGAQAYSLWANAGDPMEYRAEDADAPCFLPSEAQWEYAARGSRSRAYPWGSTSPRVEMMQFGRHRRGQTYQAETLPLAAVNVRQGMSPFGLHHMAGNVWQWCRDWYDPAFYSSPAAHQPNPVQRVPTQVRSERGGSWIGLPELCRSSYRRGRAPHARGRCLGFRCVSSACLTD